MTTESQTDDNRLRNDRLNDELNQSVRFTYLIIKENAGIQWKELSEKMGKSIPTVDRHLAELQEKGFIVHEFVICYKVPSFSGLYTKTVEIDALFPK